MKYRGFTINVEQDTDPMNPFTYWDCNPPVIEDRDGILKGYNTETFTPDLNRAEIITNLTEIVALLGYKSKFDMLRDCYSGCPEDEINEALYSLFKYDNDAMGILETIYTWKGIHCLRAKSRGYSQGDYAEVLVIATPEWLKASGCKPDVELQSTVDLYSAWAWGDVYGYTVDGIEDASCGGFFGEPETSGLIDHAKDAIDWHIKHVIERHVAKVKAWIMHKVPLGCRSSLVVGGRYDARN